MLGCFAAGTSPDDRLFLYHDVQCKPNKERRKKKNLVSLCPQDAPLVQQKRPVYEHFTCSIPFAGILAENESTRKDLHQQYLRVCMNTACFSLVDPGGPQPSATQIPPPLLSLVLDPPELSEGGFI